MILTSPRLEEILEIGQQNSDTCFICIGRLDRNVWAQVTLIWKGKQVSFSWETKSHQSCTVNYIFKDYGDHSQKHLVETIN